MVEEQVQKRSRGRPRKQPQVVAAPEAPIAIAIETAPPAKKAKSTPSKAKETKKTSATKRSVPEPIPAVEKKPKKTAASKSASKPKGAGGLPTTIGESAPPSSAPQASPTTAHSPTTSSASLRPVKEGTERAPAPPKPAAPDRAPARSTKLANPSDSKILSALAAQKSALSPQPDSSAPAAPQTTGANKDEARASDTRAIEPQDAAANLPPPPRAIASSGTTTTLPAAGTAVDEPAATPAAEQQPTPRSSSSSNTTAPIPAANPTVTTNPPPFSQQQQPPRAPTMAAPKKASPPPAQPYRAPRQAPPRPEWKPAEPLPSKYKPAARRVTLAMVAAPIAIVTSWVLYERCT